MAVAPLMRRDPANQGDQNAPVHHPDIMELHHQQAQ